MWKHWVIRASTPRKPFLHFESSRIAWTRLKVLFPNLLSAVLMPNHLHIILPNSKKDEEIRRKMRGFLGGMSKSLKIKNLWQIVPPPAEIPDQFHLRRQVRYIALNPCRKKLCSDPLEWYWSTYREVIGATVEKPSVDLAQSLGDSQKNFQIRFHNYVSGDPSVNIAGTKYPQPAVPKTLAECGIGEILAAAASALRISPHEIKKDRAALRQLFIHLAYRHKWQQISLLAQICGMSPRGVHYILNQEAPEGMSAAELCLGDCRLRRTTAELPNKGTSQVTL